MRIGFDIDGVLFPWTEVANEALVAKFGIPDPGPHRSWDYVRNTVDPKHWAWLWTPEGSDAVFSQVDRVYPDVVQVVNHLLRRGHEIHFVTHRDPRRTSGHTAAFLARHFGDHPWAGVHVLQNSVPKHTLGTWDAFVDDKPETVRNFLFESWTRHVFCPARLWNDELAGVYGVVRYTNPWQIVGELGEVGG